MPSRSRRFIICGLLTISPTIDASWSRFSERNQRSVGTYSVTVIAPTDDVDQKARDIDAESEEIAQGLEPPAVRANLESMINLKLQGKTAGDRRSQARRAESAEAGLRR